MTSNDEFAEFEAAGEVEVGDTNLASTETSEPKTEIVDEPVEDADTDADQQEDGDTEEGEQEAEKKKPDAKESQINRLKREKRELADKLRDAEQRANTDLTARLENIEKSLQGNKTADTQENGTPAPDPSDADKYPLGYLDDRYIEDRLSWMFEQRAAEQAEAVLQRQQENERNVSIQQQQTLLLGKVDDLSAKGVDLYDDFQESVVETGMRGDWDLSQATFEAAHEADNGAQILYELSQDKGEASRVAKLSSFEQLKFVMTRDSEISKGKAPRTKPAAGAPPQNQARGASSRTQINPATDNLDDFEKAWEADAKRSR